MTCSFGVLDVDYIWAVSSPFTIILFHCASKCPFFSTQFICLSPSLCLLLPVLFMLSILLFYMLCVLCLVLLFLVSLVRFCSAVFPGVSSNPNYLT